MKMYEQLQMVEIKWGEKTLFFADAADAKDFVVDTANEYNYGFFRYYEIDGTHYYDCGPLTFTSTVKLFNFQ